ncbi:hypothetical protein [Variovorax sp. E3]|uniref:hypothetical protein n=1 Tax=Variovorax sp. E3 TaxID=1914993 RepID=UPI0022B5E6EE|nr:hypothetical protein [Variovorax sp. E3]
MPSPQVGMVALRIGSARNCRRRSAATGASTDQKDSTHSMRRPTICRGATRSPTRRSGPSCSGGMRASPGTASTHHSGRGARTGAMTGTARGTDTAAAAVESG